MFYSKGHDKGNKEVILELSIREGRIFSSGQQPIARTIKKVGETKSYLLTKEDKNLATIQDNKGS
jgi:hypothetical protein